jgi:tripartite-type tricarboxylate transporter receptor subunit TctC
MRTFLIASQGVLLAATVLLGAGVALAQAYPNRVVRLVVPSTAGSGGDVIVRIITPGLSEVFRQQVIVDNRAGAAQNIGAELVARAPADGYTLLNVSSTLTANVNLYRNLPYDLVRDFAPVTQIALSPQLVVVHPSLPVKTVGELVKLARSKPGQIIYSSGGFGGATYVPGEMFNAMAGVQLLHVPYKGGGPAMIAILSGEAQVYFAPVVTALPYIKDNRLRAIAVTSNQRLPQLPSLPTVAETGVKGYDFSNWFGLMVPAKTPADTIATIQRAVASVLKRPEVVSRLGEFGCVAVGNSPEEFAAAVKADIASLGALFKRVGIQPEAAPAN